MHRISTISVLFLLLPASSFVFGQHEKQETENLKRFEISKPLMGVKFGFVVYAEDIEKARAGIIAAVERIAELDSSMSDYDRDSELSVVCRQAQPGMPIKISSDLMEILQLSDNLNKLSNGCFDPTVAPLSKLWRKARKSKSIPTKEQIAQTLKRVGWKSIKLEQQASTITFDKPGMELDLGGIAKGFAADEAIRIFREKGIPSCLVDAGGDVTVGDAPPNKKGWNIAISEADGQRLTLTNGSVATSGDRFQFLEHNGKHYSHIIHPLTGWGVTDRRLVTVVCQLDKRSGSMADAFASAFSLMDVNTVKKRIDEYKVKGVLIQSMIDGDKKRLLGTGRLVK